MPRSHSGTPIFTAGLAAAALAALLSIAPAAQAKKGDSNSTTASVVDRGTPDFEWSGAMKSGQTLWIKGINGGIRASASTGDKVEIRAYKTAHRSDPASVRVEMSQNADGISVCSIYPAAPGSPPNTCENGEHSHSSSRNNDVVVEYVVRVPAGVHFSAATVNGDVQIDELSGSIQANTVNGGIHLASLDQAEAQTVNGSIYATIGSRTWSDALEFQTVNGGIELNLPEDVSADVKASNVNGDIETDFPLTVRGKIGRHHIEGTIGKGGAPLRLETVNGHIKLHQAGSGT